MNVHDESVHQAPEREAIDQLLTRAGIPPRTARALATRLAPATGPAYPTEIAAEGVAAAAYRAAASFPPRRPSMIKSLLAKLLTLKAAALLVALSAGGVALAATTGALSDPPAAPGQQDRPGAPAHSTPDATPSPSLAGLCTAYLAGAGADHGKALDSPAFTVLITAAGGRDQVEAFCASLPAGTGGEDHSPKAHPTRSDADADTDTDTGGEHQNGPPTTHPGGPPSHPGS